MWVVGYLDTNERGRRVYQRHSAWDTRAEALKQQQVLEDRGYTAVQVDRDLTVQTANGHYYV